MRLARCPSAVELAGLFLGGLPEQELEAIDQHVAECSSCLEITKRLHLEKDTLPDQLRSETAINPDVNQPEVERLIEQLKALRPAPIDTRSRSEPAGQDESEPEAGLCNFLAPAQTAGEMGRLGNYRVLKVLGHGGMGVVFLAEDVRLKRQVALKALLPSLAASPIACKRFLREAEAMAAVKHDHVVTLYQVDSDRGVPFLAMELLQGESLDQRLRRQSRLPSTEVLRIGREVAEALAAAHAQGLIHRDVKPANIWLEAEVRGQKSGVTEEASAGDGSLPPASCLLPPGSGRVKLVDFGLARALSDSRQLTHQGTIVGTPAYMAPEQAAGKPVDARIDLFSLGCVLYRMCTGELPFNGDDTLAILSALALATPKPPREVNPEVPEQLSRLVLQLLAKRPEERPGSAREVASALASLSADPTLEVVRPRLTEGRRIRPAWRHLAVALGLIVALVSVGWGLSLLLPSGDSRPDAPPSNDLLAPASAADALDHKKVPLQLLARLGGGDPDQAAPELVAVLGDTAPFEPFEGLKAFGWRPDGKVLATALKDIKLWDVETGNLLDSFGAGDDVRDGEFSPDGKLLAIVRGGEIWDVAKRQVVQRFSGEGKMIHSLRFSPQGDRLAITLHGGTILLWDVTRGEKITSYACYPNGHIYGFAFSPDGSKLATASLGARPCVWDAKTGTKLATCQAVGEKADNYTVSFSKDGKRVVSTCPLDRRAYVWNAATGAKEMEIEGLEQGLYGAAYSPDGALIAVWGRLDEGIGVRLCDAQTGKPVADLRGPRSTVYAVRFSRDGKRLAASADDKRVYVWDVATGKAVPPQQGHTGPVRAVAFSPDGQALASAGDDGTVQLWDLATARWRRTLTGHEGAVTGLAFQRGSHLLASGGADGTVRLWDLAADKVQTLKGRQRGEVRVAFSPDDTTLASAGQDSVKFWDLLSFTPRRDLPLAAGSRALAFSADGKLLTVGCADGAVHVWDTGAGLERPAPKLAMGPAILDVAFNPREPLLAVCGAPSAGIRFWDLAAENEKTFAGFLNPARCCLWRREGKVLVAANGQNGQVRLWDLASETPRSNMLALNKVEILGLALSPEGGYLATANGDGTVYILRLPKP